MAMDEAGMLCLHEAGRLEHRHGSGEFGSCCLK
jgi:hypothetical protein